MTKFISCKIYKGRGTNCKIHDTPTCPPPNQWLKVWVKTVEIGANFKILGRFRMIFLYYIHSMYNKRQCDPHLSPRINDLNKLDTTLHENAFTYIGFNFSGKMFYERRFPLIYSFVKKNCITPK